MSEFRFQIEDLSRDSLASTRYDFALLSCGYESRSSYVAQNLGLALDRVIVFSHIQGRKQHDFSKNALFFSSSGYDIIDAEGDSSDVIYSTLNQLQLPNRPVSILVDYSSMTRVWYNAILNWLQFRESKFSITVDFVYCRGEYGGPHSPLMIHSIVPLPGCEGGFVQSRRSVALFGLGFDGHVALGVLDRIEPDRVYSFLAVPGSLIYHAQKATLINKIFIDNHSEIHVLLPIGSVMTAVQHLYELVSPHIGNDNVVLVPLGPKPHVMACLLLSRLHPRSVSCLHIEGARRTTVNVMATGEVVATRLII